MFNYIFYKLYKYAKFSQRNWGPESSISDWLAVFELTVLFFLNLMTVFIITTSIFEIVIELKKIHGIIYFAVVSGVNYLFFVHNGKHLELEKKYDSDKIMAKNIKTVMFWIYVVGSFFLFIYFLKTFATVER